MRDDRGRAAKELLLPAPGVPPGEDDDNNDDDDDDDVPLVQVQTPPPPQRDSGAGRAEGSPPQARRNIWLKIRTEKVF